VTPSPTPVTPSPSPPTCRDPNDCDGDGLPDSVEILWGSDPNNAQSQPEHVLWQNGQSCQDNIDNDLDGLINQADPGCQVVF
jgi:hypothetical protein